MIAESDELKLAGFIKILKGYKNLLKQKYRVSEIGIFGSYVKNTQKRGSDLDVLVDFSEPVGLKYFDLKDFLEDVLDIEVDLVTKKGIKPKLKDRILREVVYL